MAGETDWKDFMSDKVLRIGVTAGVNPTAAAVMKAELLGVAARAGVRIEVLSTDEELRQDATDKRPWRRTAASRRFARRGPFRPWAATK